MLHLNISINSRYKYTILYYELTLVWFLKYTLTFSYVWYLKTESTLLYI